LDEHVITVLGLPHFQRSYAPEFSWCLSEDGSAVLLSGLWKLAPAAKFTCSVYVFSPLLLVSAPIYPCLCMSEKNSHRMWR
jgi:hypothetical protein